MIKLRRTQIIAFGLCSFLITASSSQAAFVLLDDFETFSVNDTIDGTNGWISGAGGANQVVVSDPAGASNQVLSISDSGSRAHISANVSDGDTGTLFFRFRSSSSVGASDPDVAFGFTNLTVPSVAAHMSTALRFDGTDVEVHDGDFGDTVSFADDEWYSVWIVANTATDSWESYIQGGAFTSQTQLSIASDSNFAFRSGNGSIDMRNFFLISNSGNAGDTVYLDDVYFDANSQNLANPIPEPSSYALIGLSIGALYVLRRMRAVS
ncbi:MAG: PEP-CTERM sorting domain-containing protein [Verrucomicrobiota bacterium]